MLWDAFENEWQALRPLWRSAVLNFRSMRSISSIVMGRQRCHMPEGDSPMFGGYVIFSWMERGGTFCPISRYALCLRPRSRRSCSEGWDPLGQLPHCGFSLEEVVHQVCHCSRHRRLLICGTSTCNYRSSSHCAVTVNCHSASWLTSPGRTRGCRFELVWLTVRNVG